MTKISIADLIRINLKETKETCVVSKGDLIHVESKQKESVLGIVIDLYKDKMCLFTNNCKKEWWSRYVNCKIVSYNNDCTTIT